MRAAIFDLDGTLADTAADLVGAANAVAATQGWPALDPRAERSVAGRGSRALLSRAMAVAGLAPDAARVEALVPAFLAAYAARLAQETRLYPGAEACLDALAAEGWVLAVCTNKPQGLADELLAALGVARRFAAVLGADALPVRKPDPLHLTETARRAGADPTRVVLIGDTATDRETARRAGAPCILCRHGYADGAPEALAPEAVVDALAEVPPLAARLLTRPAPAPIHP